MQIIFTVYSMQQCILTYSCNGIQVPDSRPSKCLSVATLRPGWGIKKQETLSKQEWMCLRTNCSCSCWVSVTYSDHTYNMQTTAQNLSDSLKGKVKNVFLLLCDSFSINIEWVLPGVHVILDFFYILLNGLVYTRN